MKTVIVHGPQGCGKTRYSKSLMGKFGCIGIVDDFGWHPSHRVKPGYLHLSNLPAEQLENFRRDGAHIIPFDLAIKGAR